MLHDPSAAENECPVLTEEDRFDHANSSLEKVYVSLTTGNGYPTPTTTRVVRFGCSPATDCGRRKFGAGIWPV